MRISHLGTFLFFFKGGGGGAIHFFFLIGSPMTSFLPTTGQLYLTSCSLSQDLGLNHKARVNPNGVYNFQCKIYLYCPVNADLIYNISIVMMIGPNKTIKHQKYILAEDQKCLLKYTTSIFKNTPK